MTTTTQTIRSLTGRVMGALALTLLLGGPLGCEDEAGDDKKEEAAEGEAAEGEAAEGEAAEGEAPAMPSDDELAKEAEETITADNADEAADALAAELEAELGDE